MNIMEEESNADGEDASDIRNYLDSFQKEIEIGNEAVESPLDELDSDDESTSQLYGYMSGNEIDENGMLVHIKREPDEDDDDDDSNFDGSLGSNDDFFTPSETRKETLEPPRKAAEIIRLGSKPPPVLTNRTMSELLGVSHDEGQEVILPAVEEELQLDDQKTLELVAKFAEQAVANAKNSQHGADSVSAYQTVTIVPSDTNPGELSYVLFVSEGEGGTLTVNPELSIYDLDHNPFEESFLSEQPDTKMRAIRVTSRRSLFDFPQYKCPDCPYQSPKKYLLARHLKSHSDERPHKCGVCERGFKTLASLQNHVNTHTGTRPHPCRECDSCFTTSGELVRHVRYKHTHEKPHKCSECDYASVELSKLKRHMRCHTGERPYQCPHCTYASPDTYKLKRHIRIHTGEKPYECDICQARFTQSNSLKAHKLIHSGRKPIFQCEYCPATCGRKTDLRIHMEKLHSSDNPHRCKRCGKVFLDRYSYKIHIKSHDGEKCYKCDLCPYASISARHLETHMLIHTDQKPFRCDECDMRFRQKQLLKRHKNLYHNPDYVRPEPQEKTHLCHLCSKAFRHKGNLMRHYVIHDPDASNADKESALRLGEPKGPGEDEDGEEDDDLEFLEETDGKDSDQVVVFEVIQIPTTNGAGSESGQTFAMVEGNSLVLNGGGTDGYSVIQQVTDEACSNFFTFPDEDLEDADSSSTPDAKLKVKAVNRSICTPRKRGRPRKISLPPSSKNTTPKRRGRIPLAKKAQSPEVDEQPNASLVDDKSFSLREKELDQVRELQIQKDFEECFGFDKDDDLLSSTSFQENLVEEIS